MITEIHLLKGEILFREGEAPMKLYYLKNGALRVYKRGQYLTDVSDEGSFIGELGVILEIPRTATVKAREDSTLVEISVPLHQTIFRNIELRNKLIDVLYGRLDETYYRSLRLEEKLFEKILSIFLYEYVTELGSRSKGDLRYLSDKRESLRLRAISEFEKNLFRENLRVLYRLAKEEGFYSRFARSLEEKYVGYHPMDFVSYLPPYQTEFHNEKELKVYLEELARKIVELTSRFEFYEGVMEEIESHRIEELEEILSPSQREKALRRAFMDKFGYGNIRNLQERSYQFERRIYELKQDLREEETNRISYIPIAESMDFLPQYEKRLREAIESHRMLSQDF